MTARRTRAGALGWRVRVRPRASREAYRRTETILPLARSEGGRPLLGRASLRGARAEPGVVETIGGDSAATAAERTTRAVARDRKAEKWLEGKAACGGGSSGWLVRLRRFVVSAWKRWNGS